MNQEILKQKIVEILEQVDEIHSDGFALKEYLDKLADKILELFAQEEQKWIEEWNCQCKNPKPDGSYEVGKYEGRYQNRACRNNWKHDYYFSHYEDDQDPSSTATLLRKYAVMICRCCGQYIKQQIF